MKRLHFGIMAFAFAALIFSGCKKDDDGDNGDGSQIERSSKNVSFSMTLVDTEKKETKFSTSDATFYSSYDTEAAENVFSGFSNMFNSKTTTTIVGKKDNHTLSITYLGTGSSADGKSFYGNISSVKSKDSNAASAILSYLKGNEPTSKEKNALEKLDNEYYYSALIIYKGKDDVPGSETFYYSESATVTISVYATKFITGSFSAALKNASGDTFKISDGVFNVLISGE